MKHLDKEARDVRIGIVLLVIGLIGACYFWHPFIFVVMFMIGLDALKEPVRRG